MWYEFESSNKARGGAKREDDGLEEVSKGEPDDELGEDEDDDEFDDDEFDDEDDDDLVDLDDEYDQPDEERHHPPHHKFDE